MLRIGVCLTIATLIGAVDASAWGNEGHRIVCQIAFERLTPAGRALVDAIQADLGSVEDPFDNCPDCQNAHPDDDESRRDMFKGHAQSGSGLRCPRLRRCWNPAVCVLYRLACGRSSRTGMPRGAI